MIKGLPVLYINTSIYVATSANIRSRFWSENDWFCDFINFRIRKVSVMLTTGLTTLPDTMYKNIMSVDINGKFKLRPLPTTQF
jgi:hypothetical protein